VSLINGTFNLAQFSGPEEHGFSYGKTTDANCEVI
jgi:hypothetical protein